MFNGKIFPVTIILESSCCITSKKVDKNYCKIQGYKKFFTFHALRGRKYRAQKRLCASTLKRNKLKVCISLKGNKICMFCKKLRIFSSIWFGLCFLKKLSRGVHFTCCINEPEVSKQGMQEYCTLEFLILSVIKLPSCGLVLFIDINRCILQEFQSSVALDSCCLFSTNLFSSVTSNDF